jgi:hypothetical protein
MHYIYYCIECDTQYSKFKKWWRLCKLNYLSGTTASLQSYKVPAKISKIKLYNPPLTLLSGDDGNEGSEVSISVISRMSLV